MDDERIWEFEHSLWVGDAEHYRALMDDECLVVLPSAPFIMAGQGAVDAVANTPRWSKADLTDRRVSRPQEGLIVIAYKATAERDGVAPYEAHCTSTYRRLSHDNWQVVQHQQTPPLMSQPQT